VPIMAAAIYEMYRKPGRIVGHSYKAQIDPSPQRPVIGQKRVRGDGALWPGSGIHPGRTVRPGHAKHCYLAFVRLDCQRASLVESTPRWGLQSSLKAL
jgi:hypothetical protein